MSDKVIARYLTKGGEMTGSRGLTVDVVSQPEAGMAQATCKGCGDSRERYKGFANDWAVEHASACRAV